MQNAPRGGFCNTLTFIKLPFVIKILVLSIFEWPFYTGFNVYWIDTGHLHSVSYIACVILQYSRIYKHYLLTCMIMLTVTVEMLIVNYSKTCLKRQLKKKKKKTKMVFKTDYRLMKVESIAEEHSAILSTFIKLPFVIKICVLSIFEWRLKTGFTV